MIDKKLKLLHPKLTLFLYKVKILNLVLTAISGFYGLDKNPIFVSPIIDNNPLSRLLQL
jgi:hypothetical protein